MTLKEVLKRMKEQVENGDCEDAHCKADGLLLEALRALVVYVDDSNVNVVERIIDAWGDVGKWYA